MACPYRGARPLICSSRPGVVVDRGLRYARRHKIIHERSEIGRRAPAASTWHNKGSLRLLKWAEYSTDWDPRTDSRTPIWEALHQLIRALKQGGESSSGAILAALGGKAEAVRQLAYRLYTLCERLGHAEDARAYNELITSWTGIEAASASAPNSTVCLS